MMKNSITFLIAQRISSVMDAEKILVMEDGEIIGSGTHHELMDTCDVYQDIYQSQLGKKEVPYVQQ